MEQTRIFLDHINGYQNPSSLHTEGRKVASERDEARAWVARLIGAETQEILFTSSGTEANTWALTGLTKANGEASPGHLVVSAIEHLSILQTVRRMEKEGWKVTFLGVDHQGRVSPETLERALMPQTVLVSIQWANGEVGTVQPMAELVKRVKEKALLLRGKRILFHTDAVAAAGQIPIDVKEIPVDALSFAAHPFGGPPGVGALYLKKGVRILPLFLGGAQEDGRRAGTENLQGIKQMAEAAGSAWKELQAGNEDRIRLRDRLIQGILAQLPEARLNGDPVDRLPGHVSIGLPGVDAESLVLALDIRGIAVGIGSACTSLTRKASHVLKALGVEDSYALGTITLTLGSQTTEAQIERVLQILPEVVFQQQGKLLQRV